MSTLSTKLKNNPIKNNYLLTLKVLKSAETIFNSYSEGGLHLPEAGKTLPNIPGSNIQHSSHWAQQ